MKTSHLRFPQHTNVRPFLQQLATWPHLNLILGLTSLLGFIAFSFSHECSSVFSTACHMASPKSHLRPNFVIGLYSLFSSLPCLLGHINPPVVARLSDSFCIVGSTWNSKIRKFKRVSILKRAKDNMHSHNLIFFHYLKLEPDRTGQNRTREVETPTLARRSDCTRPNLLLVLEP